ncbi:MAG TPA: glycosyltransferase family 39 protein, partial [Candidatus Polarisedimenticolia bacterium]|nr:glycosyltransferase family 39 protein [Candidatus Polarisedimenticolia bacterium]
PLTLSHDETRLWDLATTRMRGTAFVPPLYPFFLAALRALLGDDVTRARIAGACLSLLSIVLVYLLAERHLGPGEGGAPAWISALLPGMVYFDGRLRCESLSVLLLLGFAALWTWPRRSEVRPVASAGVVLGLLCLARPEFLPLPLLLLAFGLFRREGVATLRRVAWLLPGALLVVLPWVARNHRVVGVWAPVSTNGGYNFWKSFNPETDGSQVPVSDFSLWDDLPESRFDAVGYAAGARYIAENPLRSLLLAPAKWGHLFGPERDYLSDLRRAHFPRRAPALDLAFALAQNLAWLLLLGGGLFALAGPARSPVKDFVLAVLLTLLLVHLVYFGDDRFHMPLAPLLAVALPEAWDGSLRPRGLVRILGLLLLAEAAFWVAITLRDLDRIGTLWGG